MGVLPYLLSQGLFALPPLIGVILIGIKTRGSARALGVIGCIILLVGHVLSGIWSIMLPQIANELDLPMSVMGLGGAVIGVISAVGLVLVVCAVVAGRTPRASAGPGGQPYPPQPQGYPSYGQPGPGMQQGYGPPGPGPQQGPGQQPGPPPGY